MGARNGDGLLFPNEVREKFNSPENGDARCMGCLHLDIVIGDCRRTDYQAGIRDIVGVVTKADLNPFFAQQQAHRLIR